MPKKIKCLEIVKYIYFEKEFKYYNKQYVVKQLNVNYNYFLYRKQYNKFKKQKP
jgi:hypothetical protein